MNKNRLVFAAVSTLSLVACGSDVGPALFGNDGGGGSVDYCATHPCNTQTSSSSTSGQGGGGVGGGMGSGGTTTSSGTTTTSSSSGTCVPGTSNPTRPALGIYVIQDQSGSMTSGTPSSWSISTEGLKDFLTRPPVVPTSVALQYASVAASGFVCPTTCTTNADCGAGVCLTGSCFACTDAGSCEASDYATPAVDYAAMPGVATAIGASIASHQPDSGSIAAPVIAGAVQGAQTRAIAHADQVSAVFFVVDGAPNTCDDNVETSYASARSGNASAAAIRTFVFAFGNSGAMDADGVTFANNLANAGGTTSATFATSAANFSAALSQASRDAVACSLMTPAGSFGLILDASDGSPVTNLSQVAQRSSCGLSSSWYYTDASKKRIELCPSACSLTSTHPLKVTSVCP